MRAQSAPLFAALWSLTARPSPRVEANSARDKRVDFSTVVTVSDATQLAVFSLPPIATHPRPDRSNDGRPAVWTVLGKCVGDIRCVVFVGQTEEYIGGGGVPLEIPER